MKNLSIVGLALISTILAGCTNSQTPTTKEESIIAPVTTSSTVQTTITDEATQAVESIYGTGITFNDIYRLENYLIANIDDNKNQPGSLMMIVIGKINGTWLPLYEGNSGEISCKIISDFGFPQALLDAYGTRCTEGADYTIPVPTLQKK